MILRIATALCTLMLTSTAFAAHTITVGTAQELTNAIEKAAKDTHHSTTIQIQGQIGGNFVVPATHHELAFVGITPDATLTGLSTGGTLLWIFPDATVRVDNLMIAYADTAIINMGRLKVDNVQLIYNKVFGINNFGDLHVTNSLFAYNMQSGIITSGQAKIKNATIRDNGFGLFVSSGKVTIKNSTIRDNLFGAIANDNGADVVIKNSHISR